MVLPARRGPPLPPRAVAGLRAGWRAEGGVDSGEELRAKICGLCGHLSIVGSGRARPAVRARVTGSRRMVVRIVGLARSRFSCIVYYTYYIIFCIILYFVLFHPGRD